MRNARSDGFTLVELLLAAAIAVLLAALAWSLLSTTTRSVASQLERASGPAAAARALERMQVDLVSLFVPAGDEGCAPSLRKEPFDLIFCATLAAGRTPDLVWSDPRRIEYALEGPPENGPALMRIEETLAGPIGRATNRLLARVARMEVELNDGETWHRAWPPEEEPEARPRAARIVLQQEGMAEPVHAEFWIPVGQVFTSRITRAGTAE